MTLTQHYPIGSYVTTSHGVATVLDHDILTDRLKVVADHIMWVNVEEVIATADMPDLNDPDSIEEFLTAVDIHAYDRPAAAVNEPCACRCGQRGSCYRISSNGFHMTNGDCRCDSATCDCL